MANLLIRNGLRTAGPYSPEETRAFLDGGTLGADTLAWTEGLTDWAPLAQVLALLGERPASAAPPEFTGLERRAAVPDGVRGFSWGGFVLGPFWSVGNRVWIGLLALVPGLGQLVSVWLGFHGRELAWRRGRWASVAAFQATQRKWSVAAAVALPIIVAGVVALALAVRAQAGADAGQAGARTDGAAPATQPEPERSAQPARPVVRENGRTQEPLRETPTPAPARGAEPLDAPATRQAFERALRHRSPEEAIGLAGRPASVQREQGVLVHVYRELTLNPQTGEPDAAAVVLFMDGRATVFRYIQETER